MRRVIIVLAAVAAVGAAIFWGRGAQAMKVKLHAKDLPDHGLRIILPSDPSFDGRMNALLKGRTSEATEILKPYSFIVENKGPKNAVAYMIEWCFTGADGDDECYRQAYTSPAALMEGEPPVPDEMEEQSNHIKPNRARLFSLLNPDGSGTFRVTVSAEEAEQFKAGAGTDRQTLLRRYGAELAKYTDITVSVDGAFFDDGTFAGDDTTGFFAMVKAEVDARRDLLNDMALGLSRLHKSNEEVFRYVETVANGPDVEIGSSATPAEFYNFYKKFYAAQTLRMRGALGEEKALAVALHPLKKAWPKLEKKPKAKG